MVRERPPNSSCTDTGSPTGKSDTVTLAPSTQAWAKTDIRCDVWAYAGSIIDFTIGRFQVTPAIVDVRTTVDLLKNDRRFTAIPGADRALVSLIDSS